MASLVYIDEPAKSPRRMACRKCKAKPGENRATQHHIHQAVSELRRARALRPDKTMRELLGQVELKLDDKEKSA